MKYYRFSEPCSGRLDTIICEKKAMKQLLEKLKLLGFESVSSKSVSIIWVYLIYA